MDPDYEQIKEEERMRLSVFYSTIQRIQKKLKDDEKLELRTDKKGMFVFPDKYNEKPIKPPLCLMNKPTFKLGDDPFDEKNDCFSKKK